MSDCYNPGQLLHVAKLLRTPPKWMILGGPSTANEAQTAVVTWPNVRVIGVEPNPRCREWQRANGWPKTARLIAGLLSDVPEYTPFYPVAGPSGGTVIAHDPDAPAIDVAAFTIDQLDDLYGPLEDVLLWLDVEGSEVPALRGAKNLLASGRVLAVSVEVCERTPRATDEVASILTAAGLVGPTRWASSPPAYHDDLWVRP